jgi:RNA polymerase sigma-32 factor
MPQCDTISTGTARADLFEANRAQEPFLIKAWRVKKDGRALQKLIENYKPMINKQVFRILAGRAISHSHRADLEQECTIAFINAVNAYDSEKSSSLVAFAEKYTRNTLLQYSLDFRSSYRIGRGSDERKAYYAAQKIRADRAGRNNDHISQADIQEISKKTGASLKATQRAVESSQATQTTLDDAHNDLIEADHGEAFATNATRKEAMKEVAIFLQGVSDRNRQIIQKLFLSDDYTSLVQLADKFGVSPERIGQIKKKVLGDLAKHLNKKGIDADSVLG